MCVYHYIAFVERKCGVFVHADCVLLCVYVCLYARVANESSVSAQNTLPGSQQTATVLFIRSSVPLFLFFIFYSFLHSSFPLVILLLFFFNFLWTKGTEAREERKDGAMAGCLNKVLFLVLCTRVASFGIDDGCVGVWCVVRSLGFVGEVCTFVSDEVSAEDDEQA